MDTSGQRPQKQQRFLWKASIFDHLHSDHILYQAVLFFLLQINMYK